MIGDVGGHVTDLRRELVRLGADPETGRLPEDLTVVQVGDLIHRGPDSAAVVALVDGYLTDQPGQWVQLVGNHEAQYLRDPAFDWPERLQGPTVQTLRRWWADGQMRAAVAVSSSTEEFLITHAGLTRGFWDSVVDRIVVASSVAAAINSLIGTHEDVLFHAGHMLRRGKPNPVAGPIWAAAATELVPSWLTSMLPFSQIHGHSSVYDWHHGCFYGSGDLARVTTVDEEAKHETSTLAGGRLIGIDPGHGRHAQRAWRSWVIKGKAGS